MNNETTRGDDFQSLLKEFLRVAYLLTMKDKTFTTVYENGEFMKKNGDYIFMFTCFPYTYTVPYLLEIALTNPLDYTDYFEISFQIAGEKRIKEIEEEVSLLTSGVESDFERELIRAQIYRKHNMKITSMRILQDLGLDIEDML